MLARHRVPVLLIPQGSAEGIARRIQSSLVVAKHWMGRSKEELSEEVRLEDVGDMFKRGQELQVRFSASPQAVGCPRPV